MNGPKVLKTLTIGAVALNPGAPGVERRLAELVSKGVDPKEAAKRLERLAGMKPPAIRGDWTPLLGGGADDQEAERKRLQDALEAQKAAEDAAAAERAALEEEALQEDAERAAAEQAAADMRAEIAAEIAAEVEAENARVVAEEEARVAAEIAAAEEERAAAERAAAEAAEAAEAAKPARKGRARK